MDDRITELMNQLSDLEASQVDELESQLLNEFETVESLELSTETVDQMTQLAAHLDSVRGELQSRKAQAIELAARASEASSRVHGAGTESETSVVEDVATEASAEEASAEEVPAEEIPVAEAAPAAEASVEEAAVEAEEPADAEAASDEAAFVPGKKGVNPFVDQKDPATGPEAETPEEEAPEGPDDVEPTTEGDTPVPADKAKDKQKKVFATMSEESAVVEEAIELSTEDTATASVETLEVPTDTATEASAEEVAPEAPAEEAPAAEFAAEETAEAVAEVTEGAENAVQEEAPSTPATPNLEAPVTAAAENADLTPEVPADRRPVTPVPAATVAITAGADVPGFTAGSSLSDMAEVADAMVRRIHSLRRVNGGDGEQHIVASLTTSFSAEHTLGTDAEENWTKIQNAVGPEALVAAGGHQAPHEVRYEIFGFGTADRPVKEALPKFQADRGGIRYILPPVLPSYASAVGVWTSANDAATTPSPAAKNSLTVAAATETTASTDAVTLQMQFGNLLTRAYPELVARHNELGLIQHARAAELNLLALIGAGSTAVTTASLIGFGRDFLVQVARAAVAYRSRHRLDPKNPLRVIIPTWVKDAMAADLTLSMPGDSTLNAYAEIDGYLKARGVNVSYSLDQDSYGAQSSGALIEFKDSFTWYLFAEGTFLFLDGGTLDLGIIRDSGLVGTNDYKMFVETFEGIAKVGIESLAITSSISVNGVAAALRDTTGGATAAAIEY